MSRVPSQEENVSKDKRKRWTTRRPGGRSTTTTTATTTNKTNCRFCCCSRLTIITFLVVLEAVALTFLCWRSHNIQIIDPFALGDVDDPYDFFVWLDTTLGGGGEEERQELAELEASLLQITEDRLDHGLPLEHEIETTALDDYYNR